MVPHLGKTLEVEDSPGMVCFLNIRSAEEFKSETEFKSINLKWIYAQTFELSLHKLQVVVWAASGVVSGVSATKQVEDNWQWVEGSAC